MPIAAGRSSAGNDRGGPFPVTEDEIRATRADPRDGRPRGRPHALVAAGRLHGARLRRRADLEVLDGGQQRHRRDDRRVASDALHAGVPAPAESRGVARQLPRRVAPLPRRRFRRVRPQPGPVGWSRSAGRTARHPLVVSALGGPGGAADAGAPARQLDVRAVPRHERAALREHRHRCGRRAVQQPAGVRRLPRSPTDRAARGGAVPYQFNRHRAIHELSRRPSFEDVVRNLYFDTAIYDADSMAMLISKVGADNVVYSCEMFGTAQGVDPEPAACSTTTSTCCARCPISVTTSWRRSSRGTPGGSSGSPRRWRGGCGRADERRIARSC